MNIFSKLFSKPKKPTKQQQEGLKIYLDYNLSSHQNISISQGAVVEDYILRLVKLQNNYVQDQNTQKKGNLGLVLVTYIPKPFIILLRRLISPQDQPYKLIHQQNEFVKYALVLDSPNQQINIRSSRSQMLHNNFFAVQISERNDRCGKLYKKDKTGHFKEKNVKLQQNCLIYYKNPSRYKYQMKYILLESISQQIQSNLNSKEQWSFQLIGEKKIYIFRAQSSSDMNGWIYAIQKQTSITKTIQMFSNLNKIIIANNTYFINQFTIKCQQFMQINTAIKLSKTEKFIEELFSAYMLKKYGKFEEICLKYCFSYQLTRIPKQLDQFIQLLTKEIREGFYIQDLIKLESKGLSEYLKLNNTFHNLDEILLMRSKNQHKELNSIIFPFFEMNFNENFRNQLKYKTMIDHQPTLKFVKANHFQKPKFDSFYYYDQEEQDQISQGLDYL